MNEAQDTLTFTDATWDTAQTVTVQGLNDDGADVTGTLTYSVDGTAEYLGLGAQARPSVTAMVTDNDVRGVTVSAPALAVRSDTPWQATVGPTEILVVDPWDFVLLEGAGTTYTVRLAREPESAVTVRPLSATTFGASCRRQFPGTAL